MPNYDDLEVRVTALEHEMPLVRADAAAARVLAVGADRDVADLKVKLDAHTKVLSALRETQLEQGEQLKSLEVRFDGLETRFDGLETRFDGLETRFDGFESEMRQSIANLEVETKQRFAKLDESISYITTLLERQRA